MGRSKKKILLFWNGENRSAVSLFELKSPEYDVIGLLSCFWKDSKTSLPNQLDETLIQAQADSAEMKLFKLYIDPSISQITESEDFLNELKQLKEAEGVEAVAFNAVSDAEEKSRIEKLLADSGLKAVFPLWGWEPALVNQAFSGLGHQAIVYGIQDSKLPPAFLGRAFNTSFIEDMPSTADICGERGDFYCFVFDGPFFQHKISFSTGERYQKTDFSYLSLSSGEQQATSQKRMN